MRRLRAHQESGMETDQIFLANFCTVCRALEGKEQQGPTGYHDLITQVV